MITPYSHLKNIPLNIIFPEINNIGKKLLRIVIVNYNPETMLFYSGKKLIFEHENLQSPLIGEFVISTNNNYYILLDANLTFQITANTSIIYNTSFTVDNDNESITGADLLSKYNKQKENFVVEGIELIGTYGLLSSDHYSKLKTLTKTDLFDLGVTFENLNVFKFIGAVKLNFVNGVFKHKFGIVGEITNTEWELNIFDDNFQNISLNISHLSYSVKCEFTLKLKFVTHTNSSKYITFELMINSEDFGSQNPEHKIFHQFIDKSDILLSESFISNVDFIYKTISTEMLNFGEEIEYFKFDKYLLGYNRLEPVLSLTKDIQITNNSDLNLLINPNNYFGLESQIEDFENIPEQVTKSFKLEVKPIFVNNTNFAVTQTLYSFTALNKPLTFHRLITNLVIGDWENIDNHQVLSSNIVTNPSARLVTDTQISNWNSTTSSVWKNPVSLFSDLFATYPEPEIGWTVFVVSEKLNYIYTGLMWELTSENKLIIQKYVYEIEKLISDNNLIPGATYEITDTDKSLYNDGSNGISRVIDLIGTYNEGENYTDGTYNNIPVITDNLLANNMLLNLSISAGKITNLNIERYGYNFNVGDIITIDNIFVGGTGEGFSYTIVADDIEYQPKGTKIYLQALSTNTFAFQGYGEFWNPKYNKNIPGFDIWNNYSRFDSDVTGEFDLNEEITSNNGAKGILIGNIDTKHFVVISGNWNTSTSIIGDNSGATANISNKTIKSYIVGSKVKWGGYVWENLTGNVGESLNIYDLDSTNWRKIPYNTNDYVKSIDLIEYDFINNMITRRFELYSGNDIIHNYEDSQKFDNAINSFMFGNPYSFEAEVGISNIKVTHGYCENINFIGSSQRNLTFNQDSKQKENIFLLGSSQNNIEFNIQSEQENNIFGYNCYQENIKFEQYSTQRNLILSHICYQENLVFKYNSYQENLVFKYNSYQKSIIFNSYSYQQNTIFGINSYQTNIIFDNNCILSNLKIPDNTSLNNIDFDKSLDINFGTIDFVGTETLFQAFNKKVYKRPDGEYRIIYYNNFDIQVITEINI